MIVLIVPILSAAGTLVVYVSFDLEPAARFFIAHVLRSEAPLRLVAAVGDTGVGRCNIKLALV